MTARLQGPGFERAERKHPGGAVQRGDIFVSAAPPQSWPHAQAVGALNEFCAPIRDARAAMHLKTASQGRRASAPATRQFSSTAARPARGRAEPGCQGAYESTYYTLKEQMRRLVHFECIRYMSVTGARLPPAREREKNRETTVALFPARLAACTTLTASHSFSTTNARHDTKCEQPQPRTTPKAALQHHKYT
jgi:hypothetical protein